jgi:D-alanyl-lipoteichoic acid acyltransferase DltB (MBOAT superfamily)
MLFHSAVFLVFAALFFAAWPWARRVDRRRWVVLTLASFVFYGWWDPRFLLLILASGFLDFWAGGQMRRDPQRKKLYLMLSLAGNLGSLAAFKYLGFLTGNLQALGLDVPLLTLPLPVGISFYTFQSMSYTIDIYRGELEPTDEPWHFFSYLAMFPQLVAGPIIRARELLPQLADDPGPPTEADRLEGTRWLVHGFFKKTVVADNLAPLVAEAFGRSAGDMGAAYWWVAAFLFGAQIYCDFSGYSDIARGLARWMGYEFPRNFDHPYARPSLREFWQGWHISLSTWFRDYVYLPLGGSRVSAARAHLNMWVVMLVSGLWHGANWTFVVWGAVHAFFMSLERATRWPQRIGGSLPGRALATVVVLLQVHLAWVFFRAETLDQALAITARMLDPSALALGDLKAFHDKAWIYLGVLGLRETWIFLGLSRSRFARARAWYWLEPFTLALMLAACLVLRGRGSDFIYFQF